MVFTIEEYQNIRQPHQKQKIKRSRSMKRFCFVFYFERKFKKMKQLNNKKELTYRYIAAPTEIFTGEKYRKMSKDAKCLYVILLNLHSLSLKNHYQDKKGVFVFLSREQACTLLNCSLRTIGKVFAELRAYHLIEEVEQKGKRANRIYVGAPECSDPDDQDKQDKRLEQNNEKAKKAKEFLADQRKKFLHKMNATIKAKQIILDKMVETMAKKQQKLDAMNTIAVDESLISEIKEQVDYPFLIQHVDKKDRKTLDTVVQCMAELQAAPQTKIGNVALSFEYLYEITKELTPNDLLEFVQKTREVFSTKTIQHIKGYIKTMLVRFVEHLWVTYGSRFDIHEKKSSLLTNF